MRVADAYGLLKEWRVFLGKTLRLFRRRRAVTFEVSVMVISLAGFGLSVTVTVTVTVEQ